nr:fluoride efflux transporter CrcB [Nakamurella flavida]
MMVALGALVGAPARYLTDQLVQSRHRTGFPWGTLTVNLVASLILGFGVGAATHFSAEVTALIGTGFCGALSTYSTFGYEVMRMSGDGRRRLAAVNVAASVVGGVGMAALGWWAGHSWR